jgi:type IV secretory pathway TrbD component
MIVELVVQLVLQALHLVVFSQVLANFGVAVLVIGDDDFTGIGRCHPRFAVVLSREIALPVLFILPNVLDAERITIVNQQRFSCKSFG